MTTVATAVPARSPTRLGAPLIPPALAYATLTVLGLILPLLVTSGHAPWSSDANLVGYFAHHRGAARLDAFLVTGSSVPFAIVVAITVSRLRTLGFEVPGRMIALVGGAAAATLLAISGLITFAVADATAPVSPDVVRVFQALLTALGGPGFVMFEGLFVAGVAIIGLLGGALSVRLAWFGVGVAAVSELASLSIALSALNFLLPIGRFGSLIFILILAFALPASRRDPRFRG
jgi:hypothetical protein